ncbi:MAG: hypothetical protein CVV19_14025 [Gammaproteobacteria bacterium HGW-Gammaproteobacteria-9]|nr:MAG: hypothetical protein CVV19_14025 [Gammaproteobacteria bacterium HGW-Gammaproteobacteria-9]
MAITMTPAAAQHVRRSLDGRGKGVGVRLGVRTTGCSGLAYVLEFVDETAAEDSMRLRRELQYLRTPWVLPVILHCSS